MEFWTVHNCKAVSKWTDSYFNIRFGTIKKIFSTNSLLEFFLRFWYGECYASGIFWHLSTCRFDFPFDHITQWFFKCTFVSVVGAVYPVSFFFDHWRNLTWYDLEECWGQVILFFFQTSLKFIMILVQGWLWPKVVPLV